MLNQVITELNNYFFEYSLGVKQYSYSLDLTFTAIDTIEGDFEDTFIVGEYVLIEGSRLNDGIYLISTINDTTLTIDTDIDIIISTEAEIECTVTKLFIPKELIALIAKIKTYDDGSTDGLTAESQGNRSVSYKNGSSWSDVFSSKLSKYKKLRW